MSTTLAIFQRKDLAITASPHFNELTESALAVSSLIGKVESPAENEEATFALRGIKTLLKEIEDARKATKEPFLNTCREIDGLAKKLAKELEAEALRVANLQSDFAAEELRKAREAQRLAEEAARKIEEERLAEQRRIEADQRRIEAEARAKAEAEAKAAKSDDDRIAAEARARAELDRIAAEAEAAKKRNDELQLQALEASAPKPTKWLAPGQTAPEVWKWEVTDMHLLNNTSPGLVRREANTQEINDTIKALALVNKEPKIPGLRIWKEVKVGVRLNAGKTVDV